MSTTFEASSSVVAVLPPSRGKLLKVPGVWFGIAAAIGNTIAAGIVATQGHIAALLPDIWLFLGVWAVGGIYALLGASSLAELSAAIPRSGGQYNYSRRALGEYAGFVVGWSNWLSLCGANAFVALVIGTYSGVLFPVLAGHDAIIAVAVLMAFAVLQWRARMVVGSWLHDGRAESHLRRGRLGRSHLYRRGDKESRTRYFDCSSALHRASA